MSGIRSLCRTCMTHVFDNTEEYVYRCNLFENKGLAEKLMLCSNIKIEPNDKYPPHVCKKCRNKILNFFDFQEMCRESLEKFGKLLEKQTAPDGYIPNVLGGNANVSKYYPANTLDIESKSEYDFCDSETIFDYHSINRPYYDTDEIDGNDPLACAKDCGIVDSISIAKRKAMTKIIKCEHDYSQPSETAVERSIVGGGDESEMEHGDGGDNLNDEEIIDSVEETPFCLTPIPTGLKLKMLKNTSPDAEETKAKCVSNEEYMNGGVHVLEDLPLNEESFSEMNIKSEKMIPLNETAIANITSLFKENALPKKIFSNDKKLYFENFSDDKLNKPQLKNVGFENENEEECTLNNLSVDYENEEGCTFEDLSEVEEDSKKRLEHVPEEETNEGYMTASTSEDKEIYSVSDAVLSDRKSKTGKRFSCDLCPQTFIFEERLNAHKRRHNGLRGYPCPRENCTHAAYNCLDELRQHLNNHDDIPREIFKCSCGLEFVYKKSLQLHLLKYHHNESTFADSKYVCETCGIIFNESRSYRKHQYTHVNESLWPFKCDVEGCSKSFRSKGNYKIHKNRHYGIKPFACTYCEKRFCSSANLNVHINFHTMEKKWTCSFCPLVCYTPANLRLHIRKKHENNPDAKNFPCRFCNKILSSYSSRKYHELRHTGEKPFVCEECGRGYVQPCTLKKHMQTHMPPETIKKFYCRVCNRGLAREIDLKNHEMIHTGEKPLECDKCGVKFRYQSNLLRHRKQKLCRISKTMKGNDTAEDCTQISVIDNLRKNMEEYQ